MTPVNNKNELLRIIAEHESEIRSYGVKNIGVFGSFARDEADTDSDVDVLIEFKPEHKTYDNFLALSERLEEILGRKVELVTTESLSPYIGPDILREVEYVASAR